MVVSNVVDPEKLHPALLRRHFDHAGFGAARPTRTRQVRRDGQASKPLALLLNGLREVAPRGMGRRFLPAQRVGELGGVGKVGVGAGELAKGDAQHTFDPSKRQPGGRGVYSSSRTSGMSCGSSAATTPYSSATRRAWSGDTGAL